MNVRFGSSKTVHNTKATWLDRNAKTHKVPTCSVAFVGKERHETEDAVTCKSCAKGV